MKCCRTMGNAFTGLGDAQALRDHPGGFTVSNSSSSWHKPPSNFMKCNTDATTLDHTSSTRLGIESHVTVNSSG